MRYPKLPKAVRALSSGALAGGIMVSAAARETAKHRARLDGMPDSVQAMWDAYLAREVPPWRTGRA